MQALVVNYVGSELCYPAENFPNRQELPKRLPQSGFLEEKQLYGAIQCFAVWSHEPIRHYQQNVDVPRHCIREANTIFAEIGGNQGNA
jgi:hypothetical protein